MAGMEVTVVLLSRNRSGWLGEALRSIIDQDCEGLSVVVSDNSTSDEEYAKAESVCMQSWASVPG